MKRLLLLGGGHAHVQVLAAMARQPLPGVQTLLVTPFERSLYSGMLPGLVAGHYARADCELPLAELARAGRAHFAAASATALDAAQRKVTLSDGRVASYDVLSVDVGGVADRDGLPGAREHALFVRPVEHFATLLDGVFALAAQRVLDLVVVGGGAAGVELALALRHRLGQGSDERARVCLVSGADAPLPGYPARVRERAVAALKRLRITVINERCVEVTGQHVVLGNGARLACDAPILALPSRAPAWLQGSGLNLSDDGFIAVGPTLQSTSHAEVFAAGDVASRTDGPLPRSGVYAVRAGPALAFNLRRLLAGGELRPWRAQRRSLNLLACGPQRAVASWGPLSAEGGWAWQWKNRIDRGFIAGLTGLTARA